jgi:hypothetical protein
VTRQVHSRDDGPAALYVLLLSDAGRRCVAAHEGTLTAAAVVLSAAHQSGIAGCFGGARAGQAGGAIDAAALAGRARVACEWDGGRQQAGRVGWVRGGLLRQTVGDSACWLTTPKQQAVLRRTAV